MQKNYYPVSLFKLVFMSAVSFGAYAFYVCYKNWQYIRVRDGKQQSAFWRSSWMVFTVFELFADVEATAQRLGQPGVWQARLCAIGFAIFWLLALYCAIAVDVTSPVSGTLMVSVNALGLFLLLPLQRAINRLNSPELIDERFGLWDILVITFCLLIWFLALYAYVVTPDKFIVSVLVDRYQNELRLFSG